MADKLSKTQQQVLNAMKAGAVLHTPYAGTPFLSTTMERVRYQTVFKLEQAGLIEYSPSKISLGGIYVLTSKGEKQCVDALPVA
jgi:hypothetical protein